MDFRNKISILIYLIITVLLIVGGINLKYIPDMNNSNNIEQVSYNGRTYIKSQSQTMDANLKKAFDAAKPTGIFTKEMEVYNIDNKAAHTSTVIFLKTSDGKFLTYALSGGP
jgi:hypothetical protein